ncbi:hypothetical protein [Cryptosporangium aurantiacum]|uniref:Uncharacterized protein n=1 Tax=Cryptosporangium aurantiacum TaxID=134849 RepID=A0A1M7RMU9_9ACTN|nr:hypothetical protein [Cryptosporangium aurantiacum]SHN47655.1 hypothetical protein SAMN05443668_12637 [Cryptosporangium aurantiacum]
MSGDLERRYARVLRLYPAAYRRDRGPELLATLLESAGDSRTSPTSREVSALVLGALRAHAGQERRSVRGSWQSASGVAALMLLVSTIASAPVSVAIDLAAGAPATRWVLQPHLQDLAALPLGVVALVAALRGYYRSAAAAAAAASIVGTAVFWITGKDLQGGWIVYLCVAGLLLPLVREAPRPAGGLLRYLPLVPLLLLTTDQVMLRFSSEAAGTAGAVGTVALCVGVLVWVAVDERAAAAVGLVLLSQFLVKTVVLATFVIQSGGAPLAPSDIGRQMALAALGPALLLAVSVVAVRRQLRL